MNWNKIDRDLADLIRIVNDCREGGLTEIDKDLLLEKLRVVYQDVKFYNLTPEDTSPQPVCVSEDLTEQACALPRTEENAQAEDNSGSSCDPGEKAKLDRKALLSLYEESESEATVSSEPQVHIQETVIYSETIITPEEPHKVLGEVIAAGTQTVGDVYAKRNNSQDVATALSSGQVENLREAIGVNDKFLMIRDMFGSDPAAYEAAMDKFESFGDLDDAMLYIYETYAWNPEDEGVKLLVDLLSRKLS